MVVVKDKADLCQFEGRFVINIYLAFESYLMCTLYVYKNCHILLNCVHLYTRMNNTIYLLLQNLKNSFLTKYLHMD